MKTIKELSEALEKFLESNEYELAIVEGWFGDDEYEEDYEDSSTIEKGGSAKESIKEVDGTEEKFVVKDKNFNIYDGIFTESELRKIATDFENEYEKAGDIDYQQTQTWNSYDWETKDISDVIKYLKDFMNLQITKYKVKEEE